TLLAVSVRAEGLPDTPLLRRTLDELSNEALLARTEVRPLSQPDTLRLVRQAAAPEASTDAAERLAAQAWRLGEGNPFVVLEAVRVWCAQGAPVLDGLSLPERVRRALIHRQIAESLEGLSPSDHPPHLELGRHYRDGEVWDKALAHFRMAARVAAARSAYEEAVASYSEALDVCRQASSRREIDVARVDVQVELGSALHAVGDVERALDHYR